jgi:hypothetical protein
MRLSSDPEVWQCQIGTMRKHLSHARFYPCIHCPQVDFLIKGLFSRSYMALLQQGEDAPFSSASLISSNSSSSSSTAAPASPAGSPRDGQERQRREDLRQEAAAIKETLLLMWRAASEAASEEGEGGSPMLKRWAHVEPSGPCR